MAHHRPGPATGGCTSPRTPGLARNADGSLDILIQSQRPETLASSWLPAPAGEFSLTFRAFLPRRPLLDGVVRWDHLAAAFALNAVWLLAAALLFAQQFHQARVRGALLSIGE